MGHTGKASRNATRTGRRKTGPRWSHVWGYQEVGMFTDEGKEKVKKGGEARQERVEPSTQGHSAPLRRLLVCSKLGLQRPTWAFEG